jgi:hypothetical protein
MQRGACELAVIMTLSTISQGVGRTLNGRMEGENVRVASPKNGIPAGLWFGAALLW